MDNTEDKELLELLYKEEIKDVDKFRFFANTTLPKHTLKELMFENDKLKILDYSDCYKFYRYLFTYCETNNINIYWDFLSETMKQDVINEFRCKQITEHILSDLFEISEGIINISFENFFYIMLKHSELVKELINKTDKKISILQLDSRHTGQQPLKLLTFPQIFEQNLLSEQDTELISEATLKLVKNSSSAIHDLLIAKHDKMLITGTMINTHVIDTLWNNRERYKRTYLKDTVLLLEDYVNKFSEYI